MQKDILLVIKDILDDSYIDWLDEFSNRIDIFTDNYINDYSARVSKYDQKKLEDLEIFVEILRYLYNEDSITLKTKEKFLKFGTLEFSGEYYVINKREENVDDYLDYKTFKNDLVLKLEEKRRER